MKLRSFLGAALLAVLTPPLAFAADHGDGTAASLDVPDGSSDRTDV